MNKPEKLME